jgi:hypothetical protein
LKLRYCQFTGFTLWDYHLYEKKLRGERVAPELGRDWVALGVQSSLGGGEDFGCFIAI